MWEPAAARRTPRSCTRGSTRCPAAWKAGGCAGRAGIPVEHTGALLVAWTPEQEAGLPAIEHKARQNSCTDVRRISVDELYRREPHLGPGALGALDVPGESIVCPWTTPLA